MAKASVTVDPVVVDSKHYTVEAEDDRVRVLRIRYGPGEKSPMHSHPAATAIFLTPGRGRFTFPDGGTEDFDVTPGLIMRTGPTTHAPENTGPLPFELILVEDKG
jgi:quercetin dioxygenase-like cupin family protein